MKEKQRFKLTLIAEGISYDGESIDNCLYRAVVARSRADNMDYFEREREVMCEEKRWEILQDGRWVNFDPDQEPF